MNVTNGNEYIARNGEIVTVDSEEGVVSTAPWDFRGYIMVNNVKRYLHWKTNGKEYEHEQFDIVGEVNQ